MSLGEPDSEWESPILLSALPAGAAREVEVRLAQAGHLVVSNASAHRMRTDVPLLIPEVNPGHLAMVDGQPWDGALITNPNCSVAGLATVLAPLHSTFGIERVVTTSFQAISGAGTPGPPVGSLLDNVLPFIGGEEEKLAQEHLLSVSVALEGAPSSELVIETLQGFEAPLVARDLPTSPEHVIEVLPEKDRPQPRLDRDRGRGMTVTVGRVRPCEVLGVKFFVLSHNLVRGAAGAALLNAELCKAQGLAERTP
jgi:aspartate-semialdehyde dehydrogenase